MNSKLLQIRIVLRDIAIVVLTVCSSTAIAQEAWTSDVHIALVKESDRTSKALEGVETELISQRAVVKSHVSIAGLLRLNGIYPDDEAFGAVYKLNPTFDPKSVRLDSVLLLPKIREGGQLQKELRDGYLVKLILDFELKKRILNQVQTLSNLADGFQDDDSELVKAVQNSLECLKAVKGIIERETSPLNSEMLRQINVESAMLETILSGVVREGRKIMRNEREAIIQVDANMKIRSSHLEGVRGPSGLPQRYPEFPVVVTIVTISDRPTPRLRVYYATAASKVLYGEALFDKDREVDSFPKLTSPTQTLLPEAIYYFWAGDPEAPKPVTPVTEVLKKDTRKPSDRNFDLVVLNKK